MTTHLSTRLVWHDRGWDGHICDHPSKNASCIAVRHIREAPRDDDRENDSAGQLLSSLVGWQPPCARDPGAFSAHGYLPSHLIHRTSTGTLVRSKSELIVADTLSRLGISYAYEQKLSSQDDPNDFRLPDFTVSFEGDTFYWEHLGDAIGALVQRSLGPQA